MTTGELGDFVDHEIHISSGETSITAPASLELFLAGLESSTQLPQDLSEHPALIEQAGQRRRLTHTLRSFFQRVPDVHMPYQKAIDDGHISEQDMENMWTSLTDFFERDKNNGRLLLYLPVQLLPDITAETSGTLAEPGQRFSRALRDTWIWLLAESDPRANFIDGDVLEPGLGEPPRVRKAAHLLPELLRRGIVSSKDALAAMDSTDEQELLQSLTEGLVVSQEAGLLSDETWAAVLRIGTRKDAVGSVLRGDSVQDQIIPPIDLPDLKGGMWLQQAALHLHEALRIIDTWYESVQAKAMSPKRQKWEKGVKRDLVFDQHAYAIADKVLTKNIDIEHVIAMIRDRDWKTERSTLFVRSIGEIIRRMAQKDGGRVARIALPVMESLWLDADTNVRDEIAATLSRWVHRGIIRKSELAKFSIDVPDLSSPFSLDLSRFAEGEGKLLTAISRKISESSALSPWVYPVVLAIGSRVKGYAGLDADTDAAIFFRPQASLLQRKDLLAKLTREVPEIALLDNLLEFWTRQEDGRIGLRYLPGIAPTIVGAPQVHMLFGGVWISASEDGKKIYGDLVAKYVDLSRFGEEKEEVRFTLLRQLELDVLQYRLMHKGYRRLYPTPPRAVTTHTRLIDWESDFWDSGYRRVASLLFLSRVFLPDISIE